MDTIERGQKLTRGFFAEMDSFRSPEGTPDFIRNFIHDIKGQISPSVQLVSFGSSEATTNEVIEFARSMFYAAKEMFEDCNRKVNIIKDIWEAEYLIDNNSIGTEEAMGRMQELKKELDECKVYCVRDLQEILEGQSKMASYAEPDQIIEFAILSDSPFDEFTQIPVENILKLYVEASVEAVSFRGDTHAKVINGEQVSTTIQVSLDIPELSMDDIFVLEVTETSDYS